MCTSIQAKRQTKIVSKVKSARDNITKLFKTNGRVTVFGSLPSEQTRLEAVTSLVAYSEHVVEHVENFVSILQNVAEAPSPPSPVRLLTAPEPQRSPRSAFLFNELHTIEEEVGNPEDAELEPKKLAVSSSCGPFPTSDSEAKYDAMLASEFATFSFDSDDIQEWSDEVERGKQARMDAHFVYVSEALAAPVPKLSAYFSTDSPADFTTVDKDESISEASPVKTETSETNTSSADSSLVISVDAEESRPQFSPTIFRGLRRVSNHEDLKVYLLRYHHCISFLTSSIQNLQATTDCSDSFSDLSCWSLDLGLSDSHAVGSKTGVLRRSVKCNDLRVC